METLWKRLWPAVRVVLSNTPFIGRLNISNREILGRAIQETLVTVVLSSVPLWVAIFVLLLPDGSLAQAMHEVLKNGELFLLSAGAVGPLVYVVSIMYGVRDRTFFTSFPHGTYYVLFAVVVLVLSTTVITLRAVQSHPLLGATSIDMSEFTTSSWWCYLAAILIFFTAAVHKNSIEGQSARDLNKPAEETFENEWKNRDE